MITFATAFKRIVKNYRKDEKRNTPRKLQISCI